MARGRQRALTWSDRRRKTSTADQTTTVFHLGLVETRAPRRRAHRRRELKRWRSLKSWSSHTCLTTSNSTSFRPNATASSRLSANPSLTIHETASEPTKHDQCTFSGTRSVMGTSAASCARSEEFHQTASSALRLPVHFRRGFYLRVST